METILSPTDFSPIADNAVLYADELAQSLNSRLLLFHSIYDIPSPELVPLNIDFEESQRQKLEALKTTLVNTEFETSVPHETRLKYGAAKITVPQIIREEQVDLIVLGYEGAEGLKDIFVESEAADIIKNSSCPVLLIPPQVTFKPLRKIVFATDLQGEPLLDIQLVIKLASLFGAEILFLHVITNSKNKNEDINMEQLDRLYKSIPYKNVSFHKEVNAHIEDGISQFCRRNHADMLVMGYHPKTFWQHLFTQDYTQEMAYHTYLPLLIIHYRQ